MAFANIHPFFVHAPLVLIPTSALMVWAGRRIRKDGFDTATLALTLAAALLALCSLLSGLQTDGTFRRDQALATLIGNHQSNGIAVTVIVGVAALVSIAEWRKWIARPLWWLRGALLTWAAIGCFTIGHSGAGLVYLHGAAVDCAQVVAR